MYSFKGAAAAVAIVALVVICVPLAGCGGNGSTNSSSTINVLTTNRGAAQNATWVAFQDGGGAWTQLQPTGTGQYSANVTASDGRYGLAVVNSTGNYNNVQIYHATTAELTQIATDSLGSISSWPTVTGSVTGLNAGDNYAISASPFAWVSGLSSPTYTTNAMPGTRDVLAMNYQPTSYTNMAAVERFFIKRNVNITGNYTCDVDFNGANSVAATPFNITATGTSLGSNYFGWYLTTKNGAYVSGWQNAGTGTSTKGYALPAASRDAGDVYTAMVQSYSVGGGLVTYASRVASFTSPADQTLAIPPALSGTVTQAATTPYARGTASWTPWSGASAYMLRQQASGQWSALVTTGWLKGASSYTMPDLSSATGWQATWATGLRADYWMLQAISVPGSLSDYVATRWMNHFTAGTSISTSTVSNMEG